MIEGAAAAIMAPRLDAAPEDFGIRLIGRGEYVLAKPLLFHWALYRGALADEIGYDDRWCYATREMAEAALAGFPLRPEPGYEPDGWHRHPNRGRRREGGDVGREKVAL